MAVGGWVYHEAYLPPHQSGATGDEAWIALTSATVEGMAGWTQTTARTQISTYACWWQAFTHTTGARYVLLYMGAAGGSGTCIHAGLFSSGMDGSPPRKVQNSVLKAAINSAYSSALSRS